MKMTATYPIRNNPWVLPRQHWFGCTEGLAIPKALSSAIVARAKSRLPECTPCAWGKTQVA